MSGQQGSVYITFDDGPSPEVTSWVLDLLKKNGAHATFFCVGANVKRYPEIYQRILLEGHSVGNHTMRHEKGSQTNTKEYLSSIDEASDYISGTLFRPPYGRITWKQASFVKRKFKLIMWTWLSHDYDSSVPVDRIIQNAKKGVCSGDIVVFHDNVKSFERLQQILPEFLKVLEEKKLKSLPIEV
ncbi:MAG: polysaccharide deacetylase family protein [Cryomorphaceae bacterium]|jgi:peptidoglycan/xylan/chitin deacetylase (PgdA/CDA1 family)|nr:polysaccharide deacetylase family protein [Cryomorphaceae bacterium]